MAAIKKLVVHCSDSPDSMDIGVDAIRRWHTDKPPQGRGWADIGYHAVIRRNGLIENGRAENGDSILEGKEIGAHVQGHNSDSLAICLVGSAQFDYRQIIALIRWLTFHMARHKISSSQVFGHYELDNKKTCPNLDMHIIRSVL
jgi:N-acetyl-anhydromuramyl-L-alanine amidase AmpD